MFAHEDDGLAWIAEKVRADVEDQCNMLKQHASKKNANIKVILFSQMD
jgi:hypothetical protein